MGKLSFIEPMTHQFEDHKFNELESRLTNDYNDLKDTNEGNKATYIQALKHQDERKFAISICTVDGRIFNIGDTKDFWSMQSISKWVNYAIAQKIYGEDHVHTRVGMEPSGGEFNEIKFTRDGLPYNPMVNMGAIAVVSFLVEGGDLSTKFEEVRKIFENLCGKKKDEIDGIRVICNTTIYHSEKESGEDNYAAAYKLKGKNIFGKISNDQLHKILDMYFMSCSLEINTEMGAVMAATLANGGICPITDEEIFDVNIARNCVKQIMSCGMYDFSGEFAHKVGIPAKSGVSGGVMAVVPGEFGICIWAPPLDKFGNSVKGVEICRRLSKNCHESYDIFRHIGQSRNNKTENIDYSIYVFNEAISKENYKYIEKHIKNIDIGRCDYDGRTPLHIACSDGIEKMINIIVDGGGQWNATDRWHNTPLDDLKRFISDQDKLIKHDENGESDESNQKIKLMIESLTKLVQKAELEKN